MAPSSINNALHFLSQGGYSYFSTLFPVRNSSLVKRSPLPAVTSSWIGNLARAVWTKRLDLRVQSYLIFSQSFYAPLGAAMDKCSSLYVHPYIQGVPQ